MAYAYSDEFTTESSTWQATSNFTLYAGDPFCDLKNPNSNWAPAAAGSRGGVGSSDTAGGEGVEASEGGESAAVNELTGKDFDKTLAEKAMDPLVCLRDSFSSAAVHGDPPERVIFYFANALHRQATHHRHTTADVTLPEEFTLTFKALNDACPYSKLAHGVGVGHGRRLVVGR